MRPLQCVHLSLIGTCVASCSSLSYIVGMFRGPALTRQSGGANSPSSSSGILFTLLNSIQCCCTDLCFFTSTHCCWFYKLFGHSLSLSAENGTCFIQTNPYVHGVHSVVYVHLHHFYISSMSNVRVLVIQHHTVQFGRLFCTEMESVTTLALLSVHHLMP